MLPILTEEQMKLWKARSGAKIIVFPPQITDQILGSLAQMIIQKNYSNRFMENY